MIAALAAGAAGAVLRYLVARSTTAPWGVLVVNVVGSAIGGAVLGMAHTGGVSGDLRLILLGGLCGGLTTFSTFSVESIQLALAGKWRTAALSVAANLVLGIGAAAGGWAIVVLIAG